MYQATLSGLLFYVQTLMGYQAGQEQGYPESLFQGLMQFVHVLRYTTRLMI